MSRIRAQVSTLGAFRVLGEVLLHVFNVSAVGTALTPRVDPAHNQATDTALGRLHGLALVAVPAYIAAKWAPAFAAVGVHDGGLLIQLAHRAHPGTIDHLTCLVPQFVSMQLIYVGVEPVLL